VTKCKPTAPLVGFPVEFCAVVGVSDTALQVDQRTALAYAEVRFVRLSQSQP
jgi:hypothetical protein